MHVTLQDTGWMNIRNKYFHGMAITYIDDSNTRTITVKKVFPDKVCMSRSKESNPNYHFKGMQ